MTIRSRLATDHEELRALIAEVLAGFEADRGIADIDTHLEIRVRLIERLRAHLLVEDKQVYPEMLAVPSHYARWLAARFAAEMGGLGKAFERYRHRWTRDAIVADLAGYRAETRATMQTLLHRMQREDEELIPAIPDALSDQLARAEIAD